MIREIINNLRYKLTGELPASDSRAQSWLEKRRQEYYKRVGMTDAEIAEENRIRSLPNDEFLALMQKRRENG